MSLRDRAARDGHEGLNVSLRSVCLSFGSSLALAVTLNHKQLFQLLSALPKKERFEWPPVTPLMPS